MRVKGKGRIDSYFFIQTTTLRPVTSQSRGRTSIMKKIQSTKTFRLTVWQESEDEREGERERERKRERERELRKRRKIGRE